MMEGIPVGTKVAVDLGDGKEKTAYIITCSAAEHFSVHDTLGDGLQALSKMKDKPCVHYLEPSTEAAGNVIFSITMPVPLPPSDTHWQVTGMPVELLISPLKDASRRLANVHIKTNGFSEVISSVAFQPGDALALTETATPGMKTFVLWRHEYGQPPETGAALAVRSITEPIPKQPPNPYDQGLPAKHKAAIQASLASQLHTLTELYEQQAAEFAVYRKRVEARFLELGLNKDGSPRRRPDGARSRFRAIADGMADEG